MTIPRAIGAFALVALVAVPLDADAQGRGKGNAGGKGRNGNGPAFCRSGAGHPVHGWAWCRQKGWDRGGGSIWGTRDRRDDGIVIWEPDRRDDRDRDDRDRDDRDRDDRDRDDRRTPRIRWPF